MQAFDREATDLGQALRAHERLGRENRAIILTDEDGAHQFESLLQAEAADPSRYRCVDVAKEVRIDEITQWVSGRH
jgi:hypothetical protein